MAYKQASPRTDAPEYIHVNNFGERKTGWNTYNPVKVEVDVIGQIKRKIEKTYNEVNSFFCKNKRQLLIRL